MERAFGVQPGHTLDASVKSGRIVLTPRHVRVVKAIIRRDPVSGLPALSAGPGAPLLTSEQVEDILSSFP
jgi:hypothetical protein